MKVEVDQELCISCGLCIDICPEVFEWNEDEKSRSKVDEVPKEAEGSCREAIESCPTEAIKEI